ncbi:MAG: hypothetical protein BWY79_00997 [Actinobacteria bacterium ADurb.Bin444]|nr:MAG: hypothetical protein BWY79_00997 [Actinobacteria bacterium ADurb.Bin444]
MNVLSRIITSYSPPVTGAPLELYSKVALNSHSTEL